MDAVCGMCGAELMHGRHVNNRRCTPPTPVSVLPAPVSVRTEGGRTYVEYDEVPGKLTIVWRKP